MLDWQSSMASRETSVGLQNYTVGVALAQPRIWENGSSRVGPEFDVRWSTATEPTAWTSGHTADESRTGAWRVRGLRKNQLPYRQIGLIRDIVFDRDDLDAWVRTYVPVSMAP
jgi:hypothetical protein